MFLDPVVVRICIQIETGFSFTWSNVWIRTLYCMIQIKGCSNQVCFFINTLYSHLALLWKDATLKDDILQDSYAMDF